MCRVGGCAAPHFQPGRCVTRGAVAAVLLQAHQGAGRLGFVAGVIPAEKLPGFERLLFRATRCGLRSSPPTGPQLTPARSPCPASAPHLRPRPPLTPPPPGACARLRRGNMFLRTTPVGAVKDPASGEQVEKSVFVVFYSGDRAKAKIMKVRGHAAALHCAPR